jgi:hypothetical protein
MVNSKIPNKLIKSILLLILVLIILLPTVTFAQEIKDTVQLKKYQAINKHFPLVYPIDVQYTFYTPTRMKTKLNGKKYFDADIQNQQTLSTSANLLLFMKKGFLVINSFEYRQEIKTFQNVDSTLDKSLSSNLGRAERNNIYSDAINLVYRTKIFGRKTVCNLITTIDFSDHGYERAVEKLVAAINIKENKRTSISVGLIGNLDPTTSLPLTPLISISHWLSTKWLLDAYMPAYLYVRRISDDNSRLSFGFNMLNGSQAFVHPDISSASSFNYQNERLELASTYQKVLIGGLTLSTKVGYVINLAGKVSETDKSNPLVKFAQRPNLSFNVGLSYNFIPKNFKKRTN